MKNFWLDRIMKREAEEAAKKKREFVYPKELWHYVQQILRNKRSKNGR